MSWLPAAHASSHYVVSRKGKIVQLVHLSDIAWHAGHWGTNEQSIGVEHEGFTYGPFGFTSAQYHASARLTAWIARRSLLPIDRKHVIGHHEVPDGRGGRGGASHHTDPGPNWKWKHYLGLVRRYAGVIRLSVKPLVPEGPLRGIVSWRAKASPDIKRVEFIVDGRVVHVDGRRPFAYPLNTTKLANRGCRCTASPAPAATTSRCADKTFARRARAAWMKAPDRIRLRVRPGRRRRGWSSPSTAGLAPSIDGRRSSSTGARPARSRAATSSESSRPPSTAALRFGGSPWSSTGPSRSRPRSPLRSLCRSRSSARA